MVDQLPPDHSASAPVPQEPVPSRGERVSKENKNASEPSVLVRSNPSLATPPSKKKYFIKKYGWLLLLLVLLGGGTVVSFVPVADVPVLASLARAMGYNEEQLNAMSFLKTLFYWADEERGPAARLAENSYSVFSFSQPGRFDAIKRGASAYGAVGEGSSALIDTRSVNASLRQQGKPGDYIAGAAVQTGAENETEPVVRFNRPIRGLSKEARASAEAKQDMYYGADTSLVPRDPTDGFDASISLRKLNAGVVGAQKVDWKNTLVEKAVLEQTTDLNKKLGGTSSAMLMLQNAGRSLSDFRYIWLTSQASRHAKQIPLKKTLAAAGFFAEEMPQKVFNATGGIALAGLEEDAVVFDIETTKEQQQRQEECEKTTSKWGPVINSSTRQVIAQINGLQGSFPKFPADCTTYTAKVASWRNTLAQARASCQNVKNAYKELSDKCGLQLKYNYEGQCTTLNLDDKLNEYEKMCAEYLKAQAQAQEGQEVDVTVYNPEQFSEGEITSSVQGTFNVPEIWGGHSSNPSDFFPETELSGTQGWSYVD